MAKRKSRTEEPSKLEIELAFKPVLKIGQKVYIPSIAGKPDRVHVLGYKVDVYRDEDKPTQEEREKSRGVITTYRVDGLHFVRRGDTISMENYLYGYEIYTDAKKAKKASKFLKVEEPKRAWLLAIGDPDVEDRKAPGYIRNSELGTCCDAKQEIRNILYYCAERGGLLVHDRDLLKQLFGQCGHDLRNAPNLKRILWKLGIRKAE